MPSPSDCDRHPGLGKAGIKMAALELGGPQQAPGPFDRPIKSANGSRASGRWILCKKMLSTLPLQDVAVSWKMTSGPDSAPDWPPWPELGKIATQNLIRPL